MPLNPSPRIPFIGLFGGAGFLLGVCAGVILNFTLDLPWLPVIVTAVVPAISFLILAFGRKIVTGSESYVLYHQLLFSLFCIVAALAIMGEPVLPYLDLYITCFGVFHFFGRIGCFFAGCCHGRLCAFGVRYGARYDATLPGYLLNRKLFPAQLLEASCIAAITVFCATLLLREHSPGAVFSWYIVLYASARYAIEFIRGDLDRSFRLTFSGAQWTSAWLVALCIFAEYMGWLPFSAVHVVVGIVLLVSAAVIFCIRHFFPEWNVSNPLHVDELVREINKSLADNNVYDQLPVLRETSQGIRFSLSRLDKTEGDGWHCALSYEHPRRREQVLHSSFRMLHNARFCHCGMQLIADRNGIRHYQLYNSKPLQQEYARAIENFPAGLQ